MLLKREYWEHKGGFLWAPLIAGGISLLLTLMAIVVALIAARRAIGEGSFEVDGVTINGLDLAQLTSRLGPEEMDQFAAGINLTLFMSSVWPFIVLAFVAFFYCLGALYDERKDRSVLFWKSLPLSDSQTVLSKVVSVGLVAPALATVAAVATMLGFALMISVVVMLHGGNAWAMVWGPASPLTIIGGLVAAVPVYALWAMPTIGWLLLCSAFARSKPFLWAIMVPLFAGIFVTWFDLMQLFDLGASWFWANIVGRLLLGTIPGLELLYRDGVGEPGDFEQSADLLHLLSANNTLATLAMPELWIGVIVGAAM
ncbi:MAG: hypothetical protein KY442_11745, partial [Proteobacteria bacterium]|nr:hypothetical protein [Pseudomonadota bacterium]